MRIKLFRLIVLGLLLLLAACSGDEDKPQLRLYVAQFDLPMGYSRLQVYTVPQLKYRGSITTNLPGVRAATHPDGRQVWVSGETSKDLSIIDARTDESLGRFPIRQHLGSGTFDPAGERFLVCNSAIISRRETPPELTLVDVASRRPVAQIPVGEDVRDVCFGPAGRFAYTANTGEDSVSVVDMERGQTVRKIGTWPGPHGVAVDPENRWLYVACVGAPNDQGRDPGRLLIYSLPELAERASLAVGLHPSRVRPTPDGRLLVVSEIWTGDEAPARLRLFKVGEASAESGPRPVLELWREIDAGHNPLSGDLGPDGRWFAVPDFSSKKLSLVDLRKGELAKQIDMVNHPHGSLAVDAVFAWHGGADPEP